MQQGLTKQALLDVESVVVRLMDVETGLGWTRERAEAAADAYKTFLGMIAKYPEQAEGLALSRDVDEFWHAHILDTRKYIADCEALFGGYLHHRPHVGVRTEADVAKQAASIKHTQQLYSQEFGNSYQNMQVAWCNAAIEGKQAAWCNAAIEGKKAAWCNAAIDGKQAAWCNAAIEGKKAAWCNAAIEGGQAAWCNAAIEGKKAAWCNAAIEGKQAAWCNAAIEGKQVVWCNAAIEVRKELWQLNC